MKTISDMKIQHFSLIFITCTLIILFSIVGCSDTPYTGSMLTPADVADYLITKSDGTYCIQNDIDSACLDLIPLIGASAKNKGPIVHIYPERILYVFYYEGNPIVRAERIGDTTDIIEILKDEEEDPPQKQPSSPDGDGDDDGDDPKRPSSPDDDDEEDTPDDPNDKTNDGHGWLIWIYYPEGTAPINPPSLSESEVTVTINGKQLSDEDITGFAQFIGANGERGIQFFYPTESAELLDLNVQMIGITDIDGTVKFNINYLWRSK